MDEVPDQGAWRLRHLRLCLFTRRKPQASTEAPRAFFPAHRGKLETYDMQVSTEPAWIHGVGRILPSVVGKINDGKIRD